MGIIKYVTDYFQEKKREKIQERITKYTSLADECELANRNYKDIINHNHYIHYSVRQGWKKAFAALYEKAYRIRRYSLEVVNPESKNRIETFIDCYQRFDCGCSNFPLCDYTQKKK